MARNKKMFFGIVIALFLIMPPKYFYSMINSSNESILLLATGDIMVHDTMLPSAYRADQGCYDFTEWFAEIKPYLNEGDLVVGNLETTLAGEEFGYTGHPAFNSPESLASNLREAGFNVLSTANNHCLDRGEKGVLRTIEHLEEVGLKFYGTARSQEERDNFLYLTQNGITVVFLAYTYGTNGIPIPQGKDYLVNVMDEDLMKSDIQKARNQADLVVVSLHWGYEYNRNPHPEQEILSGKLILWGADLILGSHPHVLQPVEYVKTQSGREGVIINSLGNFIADQIIPYTDSGMIVRLHYIRDKDGVKLAEITYVPTWIHRFYKEGRRSFRVLPVADAINAFKASEDPYLNANDYEHLQKVWYETLRHVWLTPYSMAGTKD